MRALSVKQPWCELIASGRKDLEIRSWRTDYRGPLLIVASLQPNREALEHFGMRDLPCGVAICAVDLVDVHHCAALVRDRLLRGACWEVPIGFDGWAWFLENPRRVEPTPIKGRLRLFEVDAPIYAVKP